jgi:cell division protease FtsH
LVDKTVKNLLDKCYNEAVQTLTENRALLNEIAEFLLIKETITGEELMTYVNSYHSPAEKPTE